MFEDIREEIKQMKPDPCFLNIARETDYGEDIAIVKTYLNTVAMTVSYREKLKEDIPDEYEPTNFVAPDLAKLAKACTLASVQGTTLQGLIMQTIREWRVCPFCLINEVHADFDLPLLPHPQASPNHSVN